MVTGNKSNIKSITKNYSGSFIVPIIGAVFITIGYFSYGSTIEGISIIINNLFASCLVCLGVGSLMLFISDIWFVGKRFDPIYKERILESTKTEAKYKLPFARFYPKLRPFRTIMYSWGLISGRIQDKAALGKDNLRNRATGYDIIFAWLTMVLLVLGLVLMAVGALLTFCMD